MTDPLESALQAIPRHPELTEFDLAKIDAMVVGYVTTWDVTPCTVLAVEREFQFPLVDDLDMEHPHWLLGGKIDLALEFPDGRRAIVDHKTSGEDVSAGSTYRQRLILNGQASTYLHGGRTALSIDADLFIFDVLCKPRLKPLGVTKTRKVAETPNEYRARILADISADPARYYSRIDINRSDAELDEHSATIRADAEMMDLSRDRNLHAPNDDGCFKYGGVCPFWQVCSGTASIQDPTLYRLRTHKHDELRTQVPAGKRLLTNSRRQSFNRCRRLHHFSYELGYAPQARAFNLAFGDAVHQSLEAYWTARQSLQQATAAE